MRVLFTLASILAASTMSACATDPTGDVQTRSTEATELDIAPATAPDLCSSLAAQLTELLPQAQSCNIGAANPTQCATWVPSLDGCSQPVAYAGSEATLKYLEVFDLYAKSCPLPYHPCVDPSNLTVDCTQDPNVDSLAGLCTIIKH